MSKPIEVGCIVEVVQSKTFPEWVGRQLVVRGKYTTEHPAHYGDTVWLTCPEPSYPPGKLGWFAHQLRRIDPPDWEAPRVTDRELTTEGT